MALAEKFWSRVDMTGDCWLWMGARSEGYGSLGIRGESLRAHRVAFELEHGPIPAGLDVLHECDNPPCCKPAHLFLGTRGDNNRDRARKGRSARGDRHGTHTHPDSWRGERHGRAKLTAEQVRVIRSMDEPPGHIAQQYGVSRRAIRSVLARKTWGWLP